MLCVLIYKNESNTMNPELVQKTLNLFENSERRLSERDLLEVVNGNDLLSFIHLRDFLIDQNLINSKSNLFWLSTHGHKVLHQYGGWIKYLEKLDEEKSLKEADEELERENKRWAIKQNKWLHTTRWWPIIIAISSFLISIWAVFK